MKTVESLLHFLARQKGVPVELKTLQKEFSAEKQVDKKKKIHQSRTKTTFNLSKLLTDLEQYGLLKISKNKIIPEHPFLIEAVMSVAKSGVGFAMGDFPDDLIIFPENRKGAKHHDKILVELSAFRKGRFEAKVHSIIKSFSSEFMAIFEQILPQGVLIKMIDLPDKPLGIVTSKKDATIGQIVVVKETGETRSFHIPDIKEGKFGRKNIKTLPVCKVLPAEKIDAKDVDFERIRLKYSLPENFPEKAIPLKKHLNDITKKELKNKKRINLEKLFACTIDGETAKDFDDAISFVKEPEGYRLFVHIADVSFYIRKDDALDEIALYRGNSYYLGKKVIPMLPEILSEEFCSLKPKTRRLAFTCEMEYDLHCNLKHYKFYKSVIYLNQRFTYEEAEISLQNKKSPLFDLVQFTDKLGLLRNAAGRIDLNIPESYAVFDKKGNFSVLKKRERLKSHRLVEECMLSANQCAAHFTSAAAFPSLYRNHPSVPETNLLKWNSFMKLFSVKGHVSKASHQEVQKLLKAVEGSPAESIFNYILLRSFAQASYSPEPEGHWGLAFHDYTHFTSPIRRYSDLIVHRQIQKLLNKEKSEYSEGQLLYIGQEISRTERLAMEAERSLQKLMQIHLMIGKEDETFDAIFSGFNNAGLFFNLTSMPVEVFVPVSSFSRTGEVTSLDDFRVSIPLLQKTIVMGDLMILKIDRVSWAEMQISASFHT